MKYLLLLLPVCFVVIIGCSHTKTGYNFDLEEINSKTGLPEGWGLGNIENADIPGDSSRSAYKADDAIKQHGKYSLLIDWTHPYKDWTCSNYVIAKTFTGKKIKLTGYLKTENVTGSAGLWMRIDGDGSMLAFDNMHSRPVKGTTDWKEYTIELDYDQQRATSITIGSLIEGPGKLWMDDLHITIDGKDISQVPLYQKVAVYKAEKDTMFNHASGIQAIALDSDKIKALTNLGMLWGFIKYYHAGVSVGDYNMDAELFRVLPKVLAASNTDAVNKVMEQWVDGFGKPALCKDCEDFKKDENTKLAPDYGYLFDKNNFQETIVDKLTYIRRNRDNFAEPYYIGMVSGAGNPVFKHEIGYSANIYPDAGIRLLSLYRYWNMVQYFFPDRHLIGEDWNKVLSEFIPEFCNAKDTLAYQLACLKLIARIHDTHANVWSGGWEIAKMRGDLHPPLAAKFIENKLVVISYNKDTLNVKDLLKPGDIIEKIDGVPVDELIKKYLPLTPASNYETQLRDMPGNYGFLLYGNTKFARLFINRNGLMSDVLLPRSARYSDMSKDDFTDGADSSYKMLNDNIGYIYPGKLKEEDFDKIKDKFANTKGLIMDMRCYPSVMVPSTYGDWLNPKSTEFVRFTSTTTSMPGAFTIGNPLYNGGGNEKHYTGKVVIIVNEITQSSAEFQTMALSKVPGATVIGSTTAGADGNVSEIILPGGIRTMFSGLGVLYPDGTETQRTGVKIDKIVKPTIKGIQEGRDELLEEAIKIIKQHRSK